MILQKSNFSEQNIVLFDCWIRCFNKQNDCPSYFSEQNQNE